MFFDELSNDEWARVAALVGESEVREHRRGRPRAHPRTVVNAVLWILTTGETWSKLPSHYPTVPTCRRRFSDWQANGTLIEMVKVLSEGGRSFAYVPSPPVPEPAPRPATAAYECDRLRGVFWQNPESWHAQGAQPFDGLANAPRRLAEARDVAQANAPGPSHMSRAFAGAPMRAASYREAPLVAAREDDTPMPFDPCCAPVHDGRGYSIYAIARPVADGMFRGWAEIIREGRRVERSGLIGPRHANPDEAQAYALEWSRRWIAAQATRLPMPASQEPAAATAEPAGTVRIAHEPYDERRFVKEDASERAYNERTESRYADIQG